MQSHTDRCGPPGEIVQGGTTAFTLTATGTQVAS